MDDNIFISKFGDKDYYFKLILANDIGDIVVLNKNALKSLTIVDNIFNTFHGGQLVIDNNLGFLERSHVPYTFLGNGRDFVILEFMPDLGIPNAYESEELRKIYMLKFHFVVTECKDSTLQQSTVKQLTLVDASQFSLSEKTSKLSSVDVLVEHGVDITSLINASNASRSAKTGLILQEILKRSIGPYIKFEKFDLGAENMFINSISNITYNDLLNYVILYHKSEKNDDYCILSQDRYTKAFSNISISQMFEEHISRTIETFVFPGTNTDNINSAQQRLTWNMCPTIYAESQISSFYIENPYSAQTMDHFINTNYISNAKSFKTIIMDMQTGNIEKLKEKYIELYVKPFRTLFPSKTLDVSFNLNNNRREGDAFKHINCDEPRDVTNATSLLNQLNSLLYLNTVYIFELAGMTSRISGAFIDVYRADNLTENPTRYDNNHIGRHFITSVRHIINPDGYRTVVETIKPYFIK